MYKNGSKNVFFDILSLSSKTFFATIKIDFILEFVDSYFECPGALFCNEFQIQVPF